MYTSSLTPGLLFESTNVIKCVASAVFSVTTTFVAEATDPNRNYAVKAYDAVPNKLPVIPDEALMIEAVNGPVMARVPLTNKY